MTLENYGELVPSDGKSTISLRLEVRAGTSTIATNPTVPLVLPNPCYALRDGLSSTDLNLSETTNLSSYNVFHSVTSSAESYPHF